MFGLFKRKPKETTPSYYEFLQQVHENSNKIKQEFEDNMMKLRITAEANRMFIEWKYANEIIIEGISYKMGIILINPSNLRYTIYDFDSAKYAKEDIKKLVMDEYRQLKENDRSDF